MNRTTHHSVLRPFAVSLMLIYSSALPAQSDLPPGITEAGAHPSLTDPRELFALEHFLQLSDVALERIQLVVSRIRALNEEEKSAFAARIKEYRDLHPIIRQRMQADWHRDWQNPENRDAWHTFLLSISPEEREAIRMKLRSLSSDDKMAYRLERLASYREAHAFSNSPE